MYLQLKIISFYGESFHALPNYLFAVRDAWFCEIIYIYKF